MGSWSSLLHGMVRPLQVCVAQTGLTGQVEHSNMGESSKEATGCPGHGPQKKRWRVMGLKSLMKTKGISKEDRPIAFSGAADGEVATNYIFRGSDCTLGIIF